MSVVWSSVVSKPEPKFLSSKFLSSKTANSCRSLLKQKMPFRDIAKQLEISQQTVSALAKKLTKDDPSYTYPQQSNGGHFGRKAKSKDIILRQNAVAAIAEDHAITSQELMKKVGCSRPFAYRMIRTEARLRLQPSAESVTKNDCEPCESYQEASDGLYTGKNNGENNRKNGLLPTDPVARVFAIARGTVAACVKIRDDKPIYVPPINSELAWQQWQQEQFELYLELESEHEQEEQEEE